MAKRIGETNAIVLGKRERGMDEFLLARKIRAKDSTLTSYANHIGLARRRSTKALLDLTPNEARQVASKLSEMRSGYAISISVRMFYEYHGKPKIAKLFRIRASKKRLAARDLLTSEDVNALLTCASTLRDAALVAVLWESGARIHEVLALRVEDATREASETNHGEVFYSIEFRKVKVEGEEHSSLLVEAAPHLDAWLNAYALASDPKAALFPSAARGFFGKPMTAHGARLVLKAIAKRANVTKPVHPHAFRHGRATDLQRRGLSDANVKKIIGWKPNSLMLGRYSHLTDADAKNALLAASGRKPSKAYKPEPLKLAGGSLPAMPVVAEPEVEPKDEDETLAAMESPGFEEAFSHLVRRFVAKRRFDSRAPES